MFNVYIDNLELKKRGSSPVLTGGNLYQHRTTTLQDELILIIAAHKTSFPRVKKNWTSKNHRKTKHSRQGGPKICYSISVSYFTPHFPTICRRTTTQLVGKTRPTTTQWVSRAPRSRSGPECGPQDLCSRSSLNFRLVPGLAPLRLPVLPVINY